MLYPEAGIVIYGFRKTANCDSYQRVECKRKRTGWCSSEWQGWLYVLMDWGLWQRKELLSTFITFTPASLPKQGGARLDTASFIWFKDEGHVSHKEHRSHTFQLFLYCFWLLTGTWVIFQKNPSFCHVSSIHCHHSPGFYLRYIFFNSVLALALGAFS